MGIGRLRLSVSLVLLLIAPSAATTSQKIEVTGELLRVVAIGGESTGWTIQLDSKITVDGQQITSIEIECRKCAKLEELENKRVKAAGKLSHRHGVETGDRLVLRIFSIQETNPTPDSEDHKLK